MAGEEAFRVEGRVSEALPNGTYIAALSNGHRLTVFVTGKAKRAGVQFARGDKVNLQLTPYDLSSGRILVETKDLQNESKSIRQKNV